MTDYSSNRLISEAYEGMKREDGVDGQPKKVRMKVYWIKDRFGDPFEANGLESGYYGSEKAAEDAFGLWMDKCGYKDDGGSLAFRVGSAYETVDPEKDVMWNAADGVGRKSWDDGDDGEPKSRERDGLGISPNEPIRHPEDYYTDGGERDPYPIGLFNESDVGSDRLLPLLSSSSRRLYGCESKLRDLCDELGDGASVPSDVVAGIRRAVGILKDARKRIHGEIDRRASLG